MQLRLSSSTFNETLDVGELMGTKAKAIPHSPATGHSACGQTAHFIHSTSGQCEVINNLLCNHFCCIFVCFWLRETFRQPTYIWHLFQHCVTGALERPWVILGHVMQLAPCHNLKSIIYHIACLASGFSGSCTYFLLFAFFHLSIVCHRVNITQDCSREMWKMAGSRPHVSV